MSQANYELRRATMEDLPQLRPLWQAAGLPAAELEKRFTEFQLAESGVNIAGVLGLQIAGPQARVYGEAFTASANADELRPLLWTRLLTVAKNHGLARLWTQETSPFWAQQNFVPAAGEIANRLPAIFGNASANWLTLQLKEEAPSAAPSIDHEFALFRQASQDEHQALLRRAKMFKMIALLIAFVVFALVVVGALLYFANRAKLPPQ